jgi:FKBP-type peptidyl-prolyl cis-trans isomerase
MERFWAVKVKPGTPSKEKLVRTSSSGETTMFALHATHVALDCGSCFENESLKATVTVQTKVGRKSFTVATLSEQLPQCSLDLTFFAADQAVAFQVTGNCAVDVLGNLVMDDVPEEPLANGATAGSHAGAEKRIEESSSSDQEESSSSAAEADSPPRAAKRQRDEEEEDDEEEEKRRLKKRKHFTTKGGVRVSILQEGKGKKEVEKGSVVEMHYTGCLKDGTQFDSSEGGTPLEFEVGGQTVIKGFTVGVLGMRVGEKRKIVVPSKYGYGSRGCPPDIPGHAQLTFVIRLLRIR